jgi:hypothetical protein
MYKAGCIGVSAKFGKFHTVIEWKTTELNSPVFGYISFGVFIQYKKIKGIKDALHILKHTL